MRGAVFAAAYKKASKFTRPVIICSVNVGDKCDAGIGTFVHVKDEGWIITAAHIVQAQGDLAASQAKHNDYLASVRAIEASELLPHEKRRQAGRLTKPQPGTVKTYKKFEVRNSGTAVHSLDSHNVSISSFLSLSSASYSEIFNNDIMKR